MTHDGKRAAVLFDLDGTLTNPFAGISNSIRHAMEAMGRPAPDSALLRAHIGPPLQVTFAQLLGTDDQKLVWEAVGHYRDRYQRIGKFENALIAGIPEALAHCRDAGYFLSVATSKMEAYSRDIVEHFDLMRFFDAVHGSAPDGTNANKADLIAYILAAEPVAAARAVMIGDRLHDIAGARANGMASIGVLWGFGDRAELTEAGADAVVSTPSELAAAIGTILARERV